jgi:hypothetical protein
VLAGGLTREYLGGEDWNQRLEAWLLEGEVLGAHYVDGYRGHNFMNPEPIACPKPPQPKLPAGAVDPWYFQLAVEAAMNKNSLLMLGSDVDARETSRCHTVPPEMRG